MNRLLALTVWLLLLSSSAHAQQAPTRQAEVAAIAAQHPEAFVGPAASADERKLALLGTIVVALNRQDRGLWGELLKTDQGGKVPADIIVWRPTMEHFDVLSDSGPLWGPSGVVTNPAWVWMAVPDDAGAPLPPVGHPPQPVPPSGPDLSGLARYDQVERIYLDLAARAQLLSTQLAAEQVRLDALAAQVKKHDEEPMWVMKFLGNRYAQVAMTALGVYGAQRAAK